MEDQDSVSTASTRVQEVAAGIHELAGRRRQPPRSRAESVVRGYFAALGARELEDAVAMWAPGARERVHGQVDTVAPEGVRAFIGELLDAVPDLRVEVLSTTAQEDRCGAHWRAKGTFAGPGSWSGVMPTGRPIEIEGFDLMTVRDGLIQGNEAFLDGMSIARAIGVMPEVDSAAQRRMTAAFNARTRVIGSLAGGEAELVAQGVWVVQGQPARCNVYLLEDPDVGGVTMFDAGARTMTRAVASAGAKLGGIRRIVLGHAHTDHRGTAPALGVPVLCHPDEVQDAEGSGGFRYWAEGLAQLPFPHRQVHRLLHRYAWDGGPVKISGTVQEGDDVAGFEVVHLPGHAPGQIGLWRASDRLALSSDCFYTLDIWGRDCEPRLPIESYNYDTEQARASMRKLGDLQPAVAWPGHAKAAVGDVREQLYRAAGAH